MTVLDWRASSITEVFDTIKVRRLSGALGAEVSGIDLAADLDDRAIADIRTALLENQVIVFRDQVHMTPSALSGFAERFGPLTDYPMTAGLDDAPAVTVVSKEPDERIAFGGVWHSDTTYLEEPPLGSILLAREVPPYGGDTLYANMALAYDTLSPPMKQLLDGLTAIQSSEKPEIAATRQHRIAEQGDRAPAPKALIAHHPAVRTHPETGRKALYVNAGHTIGFLELTENESRPLLAFLFEHQTRPEFTCRVTWREGTLAFWDNRSCQHNPVNDYHGHRRVMHRVTISGDRPR